MGKRSGPKTTTHFVSNKPPFYDKRLSVPPSFSRSLRPWSEQLFCSRGIVGLCCCGNASSYASCSASWCQHRHWQPRWKQHHRFTPYHGISLAWRQDTLCISVSRCLHSVCVCVCVCVCVMPQSAETQMSLCVLPPLAHCSIHTLRLQKFCPKIEASCSFQGSHSMALNWQEVTLLKLLSRIGRRSCGSPLTGCPIPAILPHFLFVYFNQENKQQNGNIVKWLRWRSHTHADTCTHARKRAHTHTHWVQLSAGWEDFLVVWKRDEWTVETLSRQHSTNITFNVRLRGSSRRGFKQHTLLGV